MKKPTLHGEVAYALGLILLAVGTVFMEKAGLGMSMVVAPAYITHLFISEYLPFFSFGMASYLFQGLMLIPLIFILRRGRLSYLFSFGTAVIYGFVLDGVMLLLHPLSVSHLALRVLFLLISVIVSGAGIALVMRSYIAPEVYDLVVKEICAKYGYPLSVVKTVYDLSSLLLAVALSLALFGFGGLVGIGVGTLASALLNGLCIGFFYKLYDRCFSGGSLLPIEKYFR